MDNVRDCNQYQKEALSRFWNEIKNKSSENDIKYNFKTTNPKTIELTKDQYRVHEDDKNK